MELDVTNQLVVLTQDAVRNFLHNSDTKKHVFFMKGSGLQGLYDNLLASKADCSAIKAKLRAARGAEAPF